ncbi:MAG TPA: leucyl aminopeptidase [Stellaceae bacterium]|jgi:leucyl aminopeptidase|nr:leucyl aminopeptidase [Stellaceae bacterium]
MKISFSEFDLSRSGALAVGVWEGGELTSPARQLDEATGGAIGRALSVSGRFRGKKRELLSIVAPSGVVASQIVLVGLGKPDGVDDRLMQDIGGTLVAHLNGAGEKEALLAVGEGDAGEAAHLAFGAALRAYRFDRHRTKEKPERKPTLKKLTVSAAEAGAAKRAYRDLDAAAESVAFTRDLVSEPANVIYPETLADEAMGLAKLGLEVEVLDEDRLRKIGMGALLGVGQGSARPSRVVVMQWHGGSEGAAPVAFVGKGVTFDTGGISIKPAAGMGEMKWDMAGAGVVIGLMRLLAARKAKVNAVGVAGLVENMPSATAQRPGDIVKSLSGQTIEVLNTDAEGRLVLADALWYCQDRFKPKLMVDLATLTGAVMVALGSEHAGLFSNNDELADRLLAAGKAVGEKLWRLPLAEAYDRAIDSDAADVKNISGDRGAGSIIGAQFIQRFVNNVPWAHLDIAGVAWSKRDAPTVPKGATAFGLRLLDRFVADYYEKPAKG